MTRVVSLSVALLVTAVVVMFAAACSSADDSSDSTVAPVVVNTSSGSVEIKNIPKRVVTLGSQWTDVMLALGVTPVAYVDNVEMQTKSPAPWVGDKLKDAQSIDPGGDLVAQVAKANPDLILAPGFGAEPDTLTKLKQLAPTIPSITGAQVDPWEDMVTLGGTIMRTPDKAKSVIAGVNDKVDGVKKANPGLAGKTFTLAYMYSADQIQVFGDPTDGAAALFTRLGMRIPDNLVATAKKQNQPRFPVSVENVPQLNSDLLAITAQTDDLKAKLQALPGYKNLDSVRKGAVAFLSVAEITGLNLPSPLSIPYVLDKVTPALEKAAA
ncbi:ABC transporter substrate-binding protein [Gordonia jinhuaensis]|nr:ABC transporter substrate-binding protein [Gordonia jinhuaensis]